MHMEQGTVIYFDRGYSLSGQTADEGNAWGYYMVGSGATSPFALDGGTATDFFINQGGTKASFTFTLPSTPPEGYTIHLTFNNAVTSLTINGGTIAGSVPGSAAIDTRINLKYYGTMPDGSVVNKWFVI